MAKVKICGLTREADIQAVNRCKPDYAGFLFYKKSIRNICVKQAKKLRAQLDADIKAVTVFRNEELDRAVEIVKEVRPDMVQLHGSEDEDYVRQLKQQIGNLPVIKAYSVRTVEDVRRAEKSTADYIMLDSGGGGTGETFDWECLREIKRPFFLAGGLDCSNVKAAIERYHPYAVDVSSGVESGGYKDDEKIRRFVEASRIQV